MQVLREPGESPAILKVSGSVDSTTALDFEQAVGQLVRESDRQVLIDWEEVDYVSSSGLRVLLLLLKRMRARRGALVLCGLQAQVRGVFEIAGLDSLFFIRRTREEAIAALGPGDHP